MIPKFRAWLKEAKRMVWVIGINFDCDSLYVEDIAIYDQGNSYGSCPEEPFLPYEVILMQSTGVKDCNGKEIYEGDIVFWQWGEIGDNIYTNCGKEIVDSDFHNLAMLEEVDRLLVIGNIYENPELKKELIDD